MKINRKEYNRKWNKENPESIDKARKEFLKRNRGYMSDWREKNREKIREYSRRYYAKNKDKIRKKYRDNYEGYDDKRRARTRKNNWKVKYGLTEERYNDMLIEQKNLCKICEKRFTDKIKPCVDHCHKTKIVRGLLCRSCNLKLHVIENEDFSRKAKEYIGEFMK